VRYPIDGSFPPLGPAAFGRFDLDQILPAQLGELADKGDGTSSPPDT
jgi:hypothetical protein